MPTNYSEAEIRAMANDTDLWVAEGCPTLPTLTFAAVEVIPTEILNRRSLEGPVPLPNVYERSPLPGNHSMGCMAPHMGTDLAGGQDFSSLVHADYRSLEARTYQMSLHQTPMWVDLEARTQPTGREIFERMYMGEWSEGNPIPTEDTPPDTSVRMTGRRGGMSWPRDEDWNARVTREVGNVFRDFMRTKIEAETFDDALRPSRLALIAAGGLDLP